LSKGTSRTQKMFLVNKKFGTSRLGYVKNRSFYIHSKIRSKK
jgi:hypothetical protein